MTDATHIKSISLAKLAWLFTLLSFPAVGWVLGWFTGASRTPVVSALMPLVFGILSAFTYGFFERILRSRSLINQVNDLPVEDDTKKLVINSLQLKEGTPALPAYWAAGIILFCIACWSGTRSGIAERTPPFKTTSKILEEAGLELQHLSSAEYAAIANFRLQCQKAGVPNIEVVQLLSHIGNDVLGMEDNKIAELAQALGQENTTSRSEILKEYLRNCIENLLPKGEGEASTPVYQEGGGDRPGGLQGTGNMFGF